jgi:hypothetical protein
MKQTTTVMVLGLFTAAAPLGCANNKQVDLGSNVGSALSDYSGSWDGYAEAFSFNGTGSDRIRLTLDSTGHGTVRFGEAGLLAPPTDPTSTFPPDQINSHQIFVGFEYPLYDGRIEGSRAQLNVNPTDVYGSWCALQTTVAQSQSATGYGCVTQTVPYDPNQGGCFTPGDGVPTADGGLDGGLVAVNCPQGTLCWASQTCTCTATGCSIVPPAAGTAPDKIDAALENNGATLVGTLLLESERVTIRLQKQ